MDVMKCIGEKGQLNFIGGRYVKLPIKAQNWVANRGQPQKERTVVIMQQVGTTGEQEATVNSSTLR